MKIYVGLDVHSKQTSYCVQTARGRVIRRGSVETSQASLLGLLEKIQAPPRTKIALETGAQAKWLARLLSAADMQPVVIDAGEVRDKTLKRGQKTDARDAFEICDGLRRNQFTKIVWIPPVEIDKLREVLARRRHFIKIRTAEVNASKFLVRSLGLKLERRTLTTEAAWQALIAREDFKSIAGFMTMHFDMWKQAQRMVSELDKLLDALLKPFKKPVEQMSSVFGVSQVTAATMIACLGDPHRFSTSNQVVAYLGCAPKTYDTGDKKRRGGITKEGPSYARAILCESAQQARRLKHPLHPYWARMAAKKSKNSATTAIATRLARILWRIWRDDAAFDLGKLNVVYKPSTTTKRSYYQLKDQPVVRGA